MSLGPRRIRFLPFALVLGGIVLGGVALAGLLLVGRVDTEQAITDPSAGDPDTPPLNVDQVLGLAVPNPTEEPPAPAFRSRPAAPAAPAPTPTSDIPAVFVSPIEPSDTPPGPAAVVSQIPDSVFEWLDTYGWTIAWQETPGPGRVSEAEYLTKTIVIWHDARRPARWWAGALAHELGHAVAWEHFDTQQTDEWNALRDITSWRWQPGTPDDFSVGEGDFAEAFMHHLIGHEIRSVGGPLTAEQRAWIVANTPF